MAVRWRGFGGAEAARRRGSGEVARRQRGGGDAGEVAVRRQEGSKGRSKVTPISCPWNWKNESVSFSGHTQIAAHGWDPDPSRSV